MLLHLEFLCVEAFGAFLLLSVRRGWIKYALLRVLGIWGFFVSAGIVPLIVYPAIYGWQEVGWWAIAASAILFALSLVFTAGILKTKYTFRFLRFIGWKRKTKKGRP